VVDESIPDELNRSTFAMEVFSRDSCFIKLLLRAKTIDHEELSVEHRPTNDVLIVLFEILESPLDAQRVKKLFLP
jgi:hypothetical protein